MRRAESVQIVPDENGWEMHVEDEDGEVKRFNIHWIAWDLARHAQETIGAWRAEGEAARMGLQASSSDELSSPDHEAYPPGHYKRPGSLEDVDLVRDLQRGK